MARILLKTWYNARENVDWWRNERGENMEKIVWVKSRVKNLGSKEDDGLEEVNQYLREGWKVKHIAAAPFGDNPVSGQAYIVIEKDM